jgi:hypothetical protein
MEKNVIMTVNLAKRRWRKGLARYQKATVFQYLKGFHKFAAIHCIPLSIDKAYMKFA